MIGLRYFGSRAQYFVIERSIGLRRFAMIEFLQGYNLQPTPVTIPRLPDNEAADISNAPPNEVYPDKIHSTGSQVEADFALKSQQTHENHQYPEWHNNPNPNAKATREEEEPGYEVPEVFREHRHTYSARPTDVSAYRK